MLDLYTWDNGQPNIAAGVDCDQTLTLPDGRRVVVRHDPLAPADRAWYAVFEDNCAGLPGRQLTQGYPSRAQAKRDVEALLLPRR